MTDAKKPRELTEQEFHWLYLEGKPVNQSYAATTIHKDRLIELMDMKKDFHKLLIRIANLREGLKQLRTDKIAIELLKQDDEAKNE